MSDESPYLFSVSVSFTSVLFSVYHLSLMTLTSSSVLFFKTGLINISDWFLCLLWDAVNHHSCVSVKEQDSSADQIRDVWHISNESQLQSYVQWELCQFLWMLNNLWWEWDTDVQYAQELHDCFNETHKQNNVTEANLWIL